MTKYTACFIALLGILNSFSCSSKGTCDPPETADTNGVEIPLESRVKNVLSNAGLECMPDSLAILAFKEERILEMYAWNGEKWLLLKQYPFTAFSGDLGPKLKRGDRQIPEGIYQVALLNPQSTYHRSLRVSYPNDFDREHAHIDGRSVLGGDIYIHGHNATIGCIPVGDPAIEEIYSFAEMAFNKGIRVIIAPRDFRVNPAFPEIAGINWEEELYRSVSSRLKEFVIKP
jgi:murein L,D-transpeptidase YafK